MDTVDYLDRAERHVALAREGYEAGDYLGACRAIGLVMESLKECSMDLVQRAYDKGAKKKDIALALDMPPHYLRGLEKTR